MSGEKKTNELNLANCKIRFNRKNPKKEIFDLAKFRSVFIFLFFITQTTQHMADSDSPIEFFSFNPSTTQQTTTTQTSIQMSEDEKAVVPAPVLEMVEFKPPQTLSRCVFMCE